MARKLHGLLVALKDASALTTHFPRHQRRLPSRHPSSSPLKDLGHHPKRLAFLGGVTQILIHPKSFPCLVHVGYLFDPNRNNRPPNKESPYKLNYLHTGRSNDSSRSQIFTAWGRHALHEAQIVASCTLLPNP